ncbi:sensor histidine kinase [Nocardia asiatica]|uniref:sensor histidine kinase n=1 Tax=Nocardia asiatica TaxID=209252 RepID=UPI002455A8B5|nr:HAMP domain-containing sensor histidine kinase [Nocardia asiatica]
MSPSRLVTARAKVSGLLSAVPLRVTLMALLVLTAGLGLLVSGMVVTSALEQQLTDRTDQQLRQGAMEWSRRGPPPPLLPPDPRHAPSQFYVRSVRTEGRTFFLRAFGADAEPDIPSTPRSGPYTVGSVGGGPVQWRALTVRTPDGTTTVALPLTQNTDTVQRLVMLELVVGAIVLAVLAVIAYFVVRRSLRPLRRVESTAAAIARGDLHRRVPVRGTNTEVDRLSRSLNGMLAQIQRAFTTTAASEEAARRSEERMRRFIADASHELRTPLTTIRGFAELYRQGATDDPATFMDRIEHEAQRMGVLVEDLLMLARLDAQRPLELGPVDLLAVASDAVHNARAVIAAGHADGPVRTVELNIEPGEGTLEVSGDEARLGQVLGNLLNNAVTHTAPDAKVTVRLTPGPEHVLLEVADTGPGLPPEDAERVFERFYRADTSRARTSGGTGLGLSIVQALVTAHGGEVGVRSSTEAGTTFTVRLPRGPSTES